MLDCEAPTGQNRQQAAHELWLAMRAAHDCYKHASATLSAVAKTAPGHPRPCGEDLSLEEAAEQQRTSFENYIEARLQYSEFMLSRDDQESVNVRKSQQSETPGAQHTFTASRPVLVAVAAVLLLPVLGLIYLAGEKSGARERDLVRGAREEMLNPTGKQSQSPAVQLHASDVTLSAIGQPCPAPPGPASPTPTRRRPVPAAAGVNHGRGRPAQARPSRPHRQIASAKGAQRLIHNSRENPHRAAGSTQDATGRSIAGNGRGVTLPKRETDRRYYEFTLTPSDHFERVGPIRLSLWNIDPHRRYVDLSMTADQFKLDQQHVKVNEPVRISVRDHPTPFVLVIDRIEGNQVRGYLSVTNVSLAKSY